MNLYDAYKNRKSSKTKPTTGLLIGDVPRIKMSKNSFSRALGAVLGMMVGDAMGSTVELLPMSEIKDFNISFDDIPENIVWNVSKGQISSVSELAMGLAYSMKCEKGYNPEKAFHHYKAWEESTYNDTTKLSRFDAPDLNDKSADALPRSVPIAVFCAGKGLPTVMNMSRVDTIVTNPNPLCVIANQFYSTMLYECIMGELVLGNSIEVTLKVTEAMDEEYKYSSGDNSYYDAFVCLLDCIRYAFDSPTKRGFEYTLKKYQSDPVVIPLANALIALYNGMPYDETVKMITKLGDRANINAAIAGALLGAISGICTIPNKWVDTVIKCEPDVRSPYPRPSRYWAKEIFGITSFLLEHN